MAVAGRATTAYRCFILEGKLYCEQTTRLRSECASVEDALALLGRQERAVVAGSNMDALRKKMTKVLG